MALGLPMPRKPPPLKHRKRVSKACLPCRRRKQRCNDLRPCQHCERRKLVCLDSPSDASDTENVDPKPPRPQTSDLEHDPTAEFASDTSNDLTKSENDDQQPVDYLDRFEDPLFQGNASEQEEEAKIYDQSTLLQSTRGGLGYFGGSAMLAHLRFIRTMVESVVGNTDFTRDPWRNVFHEATTSIAQPGRINLVLPDQETVNALVHSYFTNTRGFIKLLDRWAFERTLAPYYENQVEIMPSDLCIIFLVLSIGLVLATPAPNSPEYRIVERLRDSSVDYADEFFRSATAVCDPLQERRLWSVQALSLQSVYNLAICGSDRACISHASAVQIAHSLGLHEMTKFSDIFNHELDLRRNIWRSVFVLGHFLAASLGRPNICEGECTDDGPMASPEGSSNSQQAGQSYQPDVFDMTVRICRIIGKILPERYSKGSMLTKSIREIARECVSWSTDAQLNFSSSKLRKGSITPTQGMAILHTQLMGCYSKILLTWLPFVVLWQRVQKDRDHKKQTADRSKEGFALTCLSASTQTIDMINDAFEGGYLPRRDPIVLNSLYTATLIVLSNEFGCIYKNSKYMDSVTNAFRILDYCANPDPQAKYLLHNFRSFQELVKVRSQIPARSSQTSSRTVQERSLQVQPFSPGEARYGPPTPLELAHANSSPSNPQVIRPPLTPITRPSTGMTGSSDFATSEATASPVGRSAAMNPGVNVGDQALPELFSGSRVHQSGQFVLPSHSIPPHRSTRARATTEKFDYTFCSSPSEDRKPDLEMLGGSHARLHHAETYP